MSGMAVTIVPSGGLPVTISGGDGGQSGPVSYNDLMDKPDITAITDDIAAILARLNTISNFASPNAGGVVSGQYYDNAFQGVSSSTLTSTANSITLAPFYTSVDMPINQVGVAMVNAVAANQVRLVIYDSDANGWADNLIYESAVIDAAVVGYVFEAVAITLVKGKQYWVGYRSSGIGQVRAINAGSAVNLGIAGNTGSTYYTVLRRTVTFANATPAKWNFVTADRVANITPPSIRLRAV